MISTSNVFTKNIEKRICALTGTQSAASAKRTTEGTRAAGESLQKKEHRANSPKELCCGTLLFRIENIKPFFLYNLL